MSVPEYNRFFHPILELLKDGKPRHWSEIAVTIADQWNISTEDREELVPSGNRTRLNDRAQWALTYMAQALLVERVSRGVNRITQRGLDYLQTAPDEIKPSDLMVFPEYAAFQSRSKAVPTPKNPNLNGVTAPVETSVTPEEAISQAYREHNNALAQEMLEQVKNMSPSSFESLIVRLMLKLGYGGAGDESGKTLGRTGDEGVDGVIKQDKLGLDNIYLQAKRWKNGTVGRPDVQAFVGALSGQGASKGVFITTTSFSKDAQDYAQNNKSFKLSLIDGLTLAQLMINNDLGVSLVERYDVKRLDSDFFTQG
jgi:restriction system protein